MFGTEKKIEAAREEERITVKQGYRGVALKYIANQINNMNGSGAMAWLSSAVELAQEMGLLSAREAAELIKEGKAKFEAIQAAQKAEKERILAQHKAERIAKAKAAKGE